MEKFGNRDNRSRNGGSNRSFRQDSEPREMHKAVCDKCKKACEVPFKPTQGKPVLCRECFTKDKPRSGGFKKNFRQDSGQREMHKTVCDECKKACEVPFKPTQGKPVLCRECFAKSKPSY